MSKQSPGLDTGDRRSVFFLRLLEGVGLRSRSRMASDSCSGANTVKTEAAGTADAELLLLDASRSGLLSSGSFLLSEDITLPRGQE
jgi:hypothetical protein